MTDRKSQKPNNHGVCDALPLRKTENGQADDMGLSVRHINEAADWYQQLAAGLVGKPDKDDHLATALRERLRNKYNVHPAHLEIEAARVMAAALR